MSTLPIPSPLRVTFDSNVWQMVIMPDLASKTSFYDDFITIHNSLRTNQIQGFISETVGTLEAITSAGRKAYFTSIKPNVGVQLVSVTGNSMLLKIDLGTTHDQHPGLHRVLKDRLELAISLGMRLMRAPRIAIPVPALFLDLVVFADETDVPTSAARDNLWGEVMTTIEQRGVGSAVLSILQERTGGKLEAIEEKEFARAVAEWADGDSVAAHVAYKNAIFCTEDRGKSAGGSSILDEDNRLWLSQTYDVEFATVEELTRRIRFAQISKP